MNLYRAPRGAALLFPVCILLYFLVVFLVLLPDGKTEEFHFGSARKLFITKRTIGKKRKKEKQKKIEKLFPIEFCVGLQIIRYESLWACGFWFWDCGLGLWLEGFFVFVLMLMLMLCRFTPLGKMQLFQMKLFCLTQRSAAGHCELFDRFLQISF